MSTIFTGEVATELFRRKVVLSALNLEKVGIRANRHVKASIVAKDDLGRTDELWQGLPITSRSRIPINKLIEKYEWYIRMYEARNAQELKENIKNV